jgi:hypothetical protein
MAADAGVAESLDDFVMLPLDAEQPLGLTVSPEDAAALFQDLFDSESASCISNLLTAEGLHAGDAMEIVPSLSLDDPLAESKHVLRFGLAGAGDARGDGSAKISSEQARQLGLVDPQLLFLLNPSPPYSSPSPALVVEPADMSSDDGFSLQESEWSVPVNARVPWATFSD